MFVVVLVVLRVASVWLASTDGITDAAKRAEEIGRARTAVLAIFAGGLAAIGAYYTHRTFGLTRQGQMTDRFTRAVDQLGSEKVDVRIGGIYSLEGVAREDRSFHGPIVEILSTYVRERAQLIPEDVEQELIEHEPDRYPEPPSADVQAAITVIGRRTVAFDPAPPWRLDLSSAYLPRADLRHVRLSRADLSFSVFTEASLQSAELDGAHLNNARLIGADLTDASLVDARLWEVNLNRAALRRSNLSRADLTDARCIRAGFADAVLKEAQLDGATFRTARLLRADLRGASLEGTNLYGASLAKADLRDAELESTLLRGCRYSRETLWPDGFDPGAAGARLFGRRVRRGPVPRKDNESEQG